MNRPSLPLLAGAACLAGAVLASAQTPPRVDQADAIKRQQELEKKLRDATQPGTAEADAPELFQGELKDVGPQSILKVKQKRTVFQVIMDSQFFYTSNQNLAEDAAGTSLFVNNAQIAYAPPPIQTDRGAVTLRAGFAQLWFNYGLGDRPATKGNIDFDLQGVFGEARWAFRQGWTAEASVNWSRLINHQPTYTTYRQFYSEWESRIGVTRNVSFSETRSLTFAWQMNYHVTDSPDALASVPPSPRNTNDRMDNSFLAAYTHVFGPKLAVQPYYRLLTTRYSSQDARFDYLHSFGLSAYVTLHQNVSLRGFLSYEIKDSDAAIVPDYQKFDLGAGLNLSVRF
ncbi:MAG: hypothetical protein FD161_118 [Limisphaerales bacterium]|nr:MAG: hypothetical protein FD161_118 [Limisphaerales bacterium]KAG0510564.1 MAG: hypothetical protein E1N63_118 [Limisphaerales bacterium]TXT52837.1 MAG: hypothetical protein FD140_380 [Limisphaerales bacterium]